jgi:LTXXQ motif family protein
MSPTNTLGMEVNEMQTGSKFRRAAKSMPWLLMGAVLVSLTFLISDVHAQFGGGWGGSRSGRADRASHSDSTGESRVDRQMSSEALSYEQVEYRLSMLEQDLKLTDAQISPWQSWAEKVRSYAGDLARERARNLTMPAASAVPPTGPEHVARAVDAARNRLTALEDVESATKTLYQGLTPEQKTLADMRIPLIVAPRPTATTSNGGSNRLPDMGASPAPAK